MISSMISFMISRILLWYHRAYKNTQYHMILVHDIILNIIVYVAWHHTSISYMISYVHMVWYCIWYQIYYHDLRSAATLGCPGRSSGLAASLPSLRVSCPDPALTDALAHDPLSLCDGHHTGAAPTVAPHPDVHLVKPACHTILYSLSIINSKLYIVYNVYNVYNVYSLKFKF